MICKFVTIVALLCLVVTFVRTAPQDQPPRRARYEVVSEKFHQDPNLEYAFDLSLHDYNKTGEKFNEDGTLKNVSGMDVIVTKGSYTIKNPDGTETLVNYTADETGFHPEVITPASAAVNQHVSKRENRIYSIGNGFFDNHINTNNTILRQRSI